MEGGDPFCDDSAEDLFITQTAPEYECLKQEEEYDCSYLNSQYEEKLVCFLWVKLSTGTLKITLIIRHQYHRHLLKMITHMPETMLISNWYRRNILQMMKM